MEIDQYAFCPCGSGKKFKWCCQHIYKDIERAQNQLKLGQEEAALRIMHEVAKAHANNPEAWGQLALMQLQLGQSEQAEESLSKAFDLNPNYPFGLLTRARLRADEGELTGALILARKAAEAYHPEALDYIGQAYALIYQLEIHRNRYLAAHAALKILVHCVPTDPEVRQGYESTFGPTSPLPQCARVDYTLQHPSGEVSGDRRKTWNEVLAQINTPRLSSLVTAFEQLTSQDPQDAAAWYNLALAQAWMGENRKALEALERYYPLEQDENRAGQAAALAAVLLMGQGLENDSDWKQYVIEYQAREPQPLMSLLQGWASAGRLMRHQTEEPSVLAATLLVEVAPAVVTSESTVRDRRAAGYLIVGGPMLRYWCSDEETFEQVRAEIRSRAGDGLAEGPVQIRPGNFSDVGSQALLIPAATPGLTEEKVREIVLDNIHKYYEEVWIQRPLKFLSGNTPLDAAGHPLLRKKLRGVVQFMADCGKQGVAREYDFNRLRHKLGLEAPAAGSTPKPAEADYSRMNVQELAALSVETLSNEQLEKAFQAARKLDADEIAAHFGSTLVGRPIPTGSSPVDRYPLFSFLLQRSLSEGNNDAALDHVNEGQRQDCEYNEGRRRNDYELRRAEVHVKRREADQALDVFSRLIERSPENLKYRGKAVEGMLSLRQPDRALQLAEEGLAEARRQNDRDSEHYLMELADAARRQSR